MVVCTCGREVWEEKDPDSGGGSFPNEIQMAERSCPIHHVKTRGSNCWVEGGCQRQTASAGGTASSSRAPAGLSQPPEVQAIFQQLAFVSSSFWRPLRLMRVWVSKTKNRCLTSHARECFSRTPSKPIVSDSTRLLRAVGCWWLRGAQKPCCKNHVS